MFTVLVFVVALLAGALSTQIGTVPPEQMMDTCEPIVDVVFCTDIPYKNCSLPNIRGHETQVAAQRELADFEILIKDGCSNALVHFLCAVYAPFCSGAFKLPPCRDLCEYVRSTCAPRLAEFDIEWPPHLQCEQYPLPDDPKDLCFGPEDPSTLTIPAQFGVNQTVENSTAATSASDEVTTSPVATTVSPAQASACPAELTASRNDSSSFAGISGCAVPCGGIYFSETERNSLAPAFIIVFAVLCVLCTLFTVSTFLIDRKRFHYPERPIIFLAFCYLIIAVVFIVGAIAKLAGRNTSFACNDDVTLLDMTRTPVVFESQPSTSSNSDSVYKHASCVILFVLVHYFHMAASIWWVILTLTWFLAAALKWGEEAVERLWLLYHIFAWSIPAIQVIIVLATRLVDGDQLSGLCYTGNYSTVALGVFVFLPLLLYLSLGLVFLAIGFSALVNIRLQVSRDPVKARKLGRLIFRIAVYSAFYSVPSAVLLMILIYEMAERESWEEAYVLRSKGLCESSGCDSAPLFGAFLIKYLMLFLVGVCSTTWVLSHKTFLAWKRFFSSCNCLCPKKYDFPNLPSKATTV